MEASINHRDADGQQNQRGRAAVFFDRDGVLNVDTGYPSVPAELVLIPGAAQAVAHAKACGYVTVVVTNQSGVARGLFDEAAVDRFNGHLAAQIAKSGGSLDHFYVCPYHPDAQVAAFRGDHPDRKPNPGMIQRAAHDLGLDLSRSFLVGDKSTDVEAARAAGIPGYLFSGGDLMSFLSPYLRPVVTEAKS
ncbi:histidinol phosphatase [Ameyamaea chiangmaiensis NBRC 103196]|uniref:D,D-heptose 1,7-bisphosphate phosphatase n=1 Tax=Ameyamaea chiangmaiensis TaxID=442969 RepID=A0A850PEG5_9PROT|nr:HAD family hydrolase [Ameyamaea chiangmaiensis]MBS4076410.1 HAD family hydrolase [Ameyamaea chiangmaiensis]NVN40656.1 HAD family hydrolase [Ameyamaea chiangmaiensis]GBQ63402.1 histidinol phosphatase [Ameyamaea chiangmaiensis NBRC 103196]